MGSVSDPGATAAAPGTPQSSAPRAASASGSSAVTGNGSAQSAGLTPDDRLYRAIRDATSIAQVEEATRRGLADALGRGINVDLTGGHLYSAKEIALGLVHVTRLHRDLRLHRVSLRTFPPPAPGRGPTYALAYPNGTVEFNLSLFGAQSRRTLLYLLETDRRTRQSRGGREFGAVAPVIHELGHIDNDSIGSLPQLAFMRPMYQKVKDHPGERKFAGPSDTGRLHPAVVARYVGRYATANKRELYAEAFKNVLVFGRMADPVSKSVYQLGHGAPPVVDGTPNLWRTLHDLRISTLPDGMPTDTAVRVVAASLQPMEGMYARPVPAPGRVRDRPDRGQATRTPQVRRGNSGLSKSFEL